MKTRETRAKLKLRRPPYSEPMSKGTALLLYRGKRYDRWGVRTPHGDRVIGPAETMTYEEARQAVHTIAAAEEATGAKVSTPGGNPDATTFGDVWAAYLAWAEASGKTAAAMRTIRSHGVAISALAPMKVSTTPLPVLARWRDGLVGTGGKARPRTTASVAKTVVQLKAALNRAGIDGPWCGLKGGAQKAPVKRAIVALTGDALMRFTDAADRDLRVFVQALALTGARPNELRLADVRDLETGGLRIRHGKTKAKTGDRVIPLPPAARAFFSGLAAGRGGDEPLLGRRWAENDTRHSVPAVAAAAGVPQATLCSIRHGFITSALYAGVPPHSVAAACGTSIDMLQKTYAHVIAEREAEVWSRVDPYGSCHLRVAGGAA